MKCSLEVVGALISPVSLLWVVYDRPLCHHCAIVGGHRPPLQGNRWYQSFCYTPLVGRRPHLTNAELIDCLRGAAVQIEQNFDCFLALDFTTQFVFQLSDDGFGRCIDNVSGG